MKLGWWVGGEPLPIPGGVAGWEVTLPIRAGVVARWE